MQKKENSAPIAVFDSGVGGLTIYQALKKLLPNENYVYFADQKNAPYGTKKQEEVRRLTLKNLKFLTHLSLPSSNFSTFYTSFLLPKLIVIACNTATVAGIEKYRREISDVPIIGVVPVVKTAAEKTKNGRIAILSTVATARSEYQKKLIARFCPDYLVFHSFPLPTDYKLPTHFVLNIGCPNLVSFIERGIIDGPQIEAELRKILAPIVAAGCDTLVLGCTHYPFLRKTIKKVFSYLSPASSPIPPLSSKLPFPLILDSSFAVARHAKRILENNSLLKPTPPTLPKPSPDLFLTTGNPNNFAKTVEKLLKIKTVVKKVEI